MKKLIPLLFAGLFFVTASKAQAQRDMTQHKHMNSDSSHHFQRGKMMEELDLTTNQKTQMKALQENMKQQRDAIKNDASLTAVQKKEKMEELHKAQSQKVDAILTPEQQAKKKAFMGERKANHKMNRKMKSEQS
jgi:Spy/CpxP family protein refolding chaperone